MAVAAWAIAVASFAAVLFRPKGWPEAFWACLGAAILVGLGLLPAAKASQAIGKGVDVYLFLTGMMLLAETARRQGVFDWVAGLAGAAAQGSGLRLFALVYAAGVVVTVFLSNDATAVVLTPAVYAVAKKAKAPPLPHLFTCALIANAASFVLPISNPANLVLYGRSLPALLKWLRFFTLPSIASIAVTFVVLGWLFRKELAKAVEPSVSLQPLSRGGKLAAWGIAGSGAALMLASAFGLDLGLPTCGAALLAVMVATGAGRREIGCIVRDVPWRVLPLVAGLFVIVEGLRGAGAYHDAGVLLQACSAMPPFLGGLAASFGVAILSNLINNLPSGLLFGGALQAAHVPEAIRRAVLIGVDLGPNLSVTGSLATVLWLIALRREGESVSAWAFLKVGAVVMPPALLLASIAALIG